MIATGAGDSLNSKKEEDPFAGMGLGLDESSSSDDKNDDYYDVTQIFSRK